MQRDESPPGPLSPGRASSPALRTSLLRSVGSRDLWGWLAPPSLQRCGAVTEAALAQLLQEKHKQPQGGQTPVQTRIRLPHVGLESSSGHRGPLLDSLTDFLQKPWEVSDVDPRFRPKPRLEWAKQLNVAHRTRARAATRLEEDGEDKLLSGVWKVSF